MDTRWARHYRPFRERARSVQDTARVILELLADSPPQLTAKQIWQSTKYYENKTRHYLGLLEYEGLIEKESGAPRARFDGCTYVWRITEAGRSYLSSQMCS